MRFVKTENLEEGMILARDVYYVDGYRHVLLLKKNLYISQENIRRFIDLGITNVFIRDGKNDDLEPISVLSEKQIKAAIKDIKTVYEKNKISSVTIGSEDMKKLEDVSNMIVEQVTSTKDIHLGITELKSYDDYTYHHCLAVAVLSVATAIAMGLEKEKTKKIGLSALLHDIGKTMIDIELINKKGLLTLEEYAIVKNHSLYGGEYLMSHNLVDIDVYNGVLMHHEKYDGSGYPFGLQGENIPLFGRVIAVADVYDALTSTRSYRKAKHPHEAFEYILGGVESHFDIDIVRAFSSKIAPYPLGTIVKLSNNDVGMVININPEFPLRPDVTSLSDGRLYRLWDSHEDINITIVGDFASTENNVG